jgi:hypothetical protein
MKEGTKEAARQEIRRISADSKKGIVGSKTNCAQGVRKWTSGVNLELGF